MLASGGNQDAKWGEIVGFFKSEKFSEQKPNKHTGEKNPQKTKKTAKELPPAHCPSACLSPAVGVCPPQIWPLRLLGQYGPGLARDRRSSSDQDFLFIFLIYLSLGLRLGPRAWHLPFFCAVNPEWEQLPLKTIRGRSKLESEAKWGKDTKGLGSNSMI